MLNKPIMMLFRRIVYENWLAKTHALIPPTGQELAVKGVLDEFAISYKAREVISVGKRSLVLDYFLPCVKMAVECWMSESRRGVALSWLERNAAYVDLKFRRLKELDARIQCFALVQAPQVDSESIKEWVAPVMEHADFVEYTIEGLRSALSAYRIIPSIPRPSAKSPEFSAYLEMIIKTSSTRGEAVSRLGYANPSVIYYHMKKLGIELPPAWILKPGVRRQRRGRVPNVVLPAMEARAWVGALTQGEGCIKTHYSKRFDITSLELGMAMTDQAPIFRFCDLVGARRPQKPIPRLDPWKPIWWTAIGGLRAHRVLREILPFLLGQKLKEAKRALDFFAPDGYRQGRFGGYDVWPENEFPLRKRGQTRYEQSMDARLLHSNERQMPTNGRNLTLPPVMDTCCVRIAETLIQNDQYTGRYLNEIKQGSGLAWTTVIRHLKHLEGNSLVTKQKIYQRLGGPKLLFKPSPKLLELKATGWASVTHPD